MPSWPPPSAAKLLSVVNSAWPPSASVGTMTRPPSARVRRRSRRRRCRRSSRAPVHAAEQAGAPSMLVERVLEAGRRRASSRSSPAERRAESLPADERRSAVAGHVLDDRLTRGSVVGPEAAVDVRAGRLLERASPSTRSRKAAQSGRRLDQRVADDRRPRRADWRRTRRSTDSTSGRGRRRRSRCGPRRPRPAAAFGLRVRRRSALVPLVSMAALTDARSPTTATLPPRIANAAFGPSPPVRVTTVSARRRRRSRRGRSRRPSVRSSSNHALRPGPRP